MSEDSPDPSDPSRDVGEPSIYSYLGIDENFEKTARKGKVRPTDLEDDIREATNGKGSVYADIVRAYSDEDLKYNMLQAYKLVKGRNYPVILLKDLDISALSDIVYPKTVFMITQDYLRIDDESERKKIRNTLSGSVDRRFRGHVIVIGLTDKSYNLIFGREGLTPVKDEPEQIEETRSSPLIPLGLLLIGAVPVLTVIMLVLPIDAAVYGSEPVLGFLMVLLTLSGVVLTVLGCLLSGFGNTRVLYIALLAFAAMNIVIVSISNAGSKTLSGLTGANPPYIVSPSTAAFFNSLVQVIVAAVMFLLIYVFMTRSEKWISFEGVVATVLGLIFTSLAPSAISVPATIPSAVSSGSVVVGYPVYAFFNSSGITYHPFFGLSGGLSVLFTTSHFYYVAALTMAIAANLLFSFVYFVVAARGIRSLV